MSHTLRQVAPEMIRQGQQQQQQHHNGTELKPSHASDASTVTEPHAKASQHENSGSSTYHFTTPTVAAEAEPQATTSLNSTMPMSMTMPTMSTDHTTSSATTSSSSSPSSSGMSPYFHFNFHNEAPLWFEFLRPDNATMLAILCLLLGLGGIFYRFLHRVDRSLQARWVRSSTAAHQGVSPSALKLSAAASRKSGLSTTAKFTRSLRFNRRYRHNGKNQGCEASLESGHRQGHGHGQGQSHLPLLDKRGFDQQEEDDDNAGSPSPSPSSLTQSRWNWRVDILRGVWFMFITAVGYMLMLSVMTYNPYFFLSLLLGLGLGEIFFGRGGRGEIDVDAGAAGIISHHHSNAKRPPGDPGRQRSNPSPALSTDAEYTSRTSDLPAYVYGHPQYQDNRGDAFKPKRDVDRRGHCEGDSSSDDGARPSDGGMLRFAHFQQRQQRRQPNGPTAHADANAEAEADARVDVGTIASYDVEAGPTLRLVNHSDADARDVGRSLQPQPPSKSKLCPATTPTRGDGGKVGFGGNDLISPLHLPTPFMSATAAINETSSSGSPRTNTNINRKAVTAARKGFLLNSSSSCSTSTSSGASGTGTGLTSSLTISSHSASVHQHHHEVSSPSSTSRSASSTQQHEHQQQQEQPLIVRNGAASTSTSGSSASGSLMHHHTTHTHRGLVGEADDDDDCYQGDEAWSYPPSLYSSSHERGGVVEGRR